DLAILHIAFGQDNQTLRSLNDPLVIVIGPDSGSSSRHAMDVGVLDLVRCTLFYKSSRLRLIGRASLESGGDVNKLPSDLSVIAAGATIEAVFPSPHSREIRMTVGGARRRRREVRLAVGRARN